MAQVLHLVACAAGKLDRAAPAADLYQSDWFTKARAYVESIGAPWRILSAKHGLVDPAQLLEPYDFTLAELSPIGRLAWGEQVALDLHHLAPLGASITFLAGRMYRDAVLASPCFGGWKASVPMEGLGIGEQKAWLVANRAQLELELAA